jgi:hypothetical protein
MELVKHARGIAVLAISLCVASLAQAQRLDAETLRAYGGTYSTDCANAAAPKLRAVADMIAVERGNQRLAGLKPQAAPSFFGNSPPRNYEMTLLGEVRGRYQMLFVIYRDRQGQYATIDGDRQVKQALGQIAAGRYRRCNVPAAAQAAPAQRTPSPSPTPAPSPGARAAEPGPDTSPTMLLRDPRFRTPYYKALGAKQGERWLARLDGPAPQPRNVRVAGTDYLLLAVCKPRDCGDNNTVLLYSAAQGVVHGQIHERGRNTLIGNPPPAVAAELAKLWRTEWRQ